MNQKFKSIREAAYNDIIESSIVRVVQWNRPCTHEPNLECIRNDFMRLVNSQNWMAITVSDINRMKLILRCCLRLLPDWTELIAKSTEACFLFPDSTTRGLLWRAIIFIVRMDPAMSYNTAGVIKYNISRHLDFNGDLSWTIIDGFIDMLESYCISSDVGQSLGEGPSSTTKKT